MNTKRLILPFAHLQMEWIKILAFKPSKQVFAGSKVVAVATSEAYWNSERLKHLDCGRSHMVACIIQDDHTIVSPVGVFLFQLQNQVSKVNRHNLGGRVDLSQRNVHAAI